MKRKSIGYGYVHTTKNGEKMLKLIIGKEQYVVFSNSYKKTDKSPDMYIYKAQEREQTESKAQEKKPKTELPF